MMLEDPSTPATSGQDDFDVQVTGIAALGEPVRRALYRAVVATTTAVSRDRAAEAVGVARHTAKFHLDKLVADGLLEVEFGRPPGRGGPGAGRPAKLYRRSSRSLAVSLPARDYELAGRLLARAVTDAERGELPVGQALARAARDVGRSLGQEARRRAGKRPTQARLLAVAGAVLGECGYEPQADGSGLTLANCPFHALAQDYTDVVCGMNLELIAAVLSELDRGLNARLEPAPGRCCVRVGTR